MSACIFMQKKKKKKKDKNKNSHALLAQGN